MRAHDTEVIIRGSTTGFTQHATAKAHQFIVDEPETHGGTNLGPTPYDLLLAALGS